MGTNTPNIRRFRINPVELVIFSAVTLIFVNSVYHLFYDWNAFQYRALSEKKPGEENLISGRRPASINTYFANFEVACGAANQKATSVEKIRLTGPLCGGPKQASAARLLRTEITNKTNGAEATVFTDTYASKFSTDYIPLAPGINQIAVKFHYQGGATVSEWLSVVRTEDDKSRRPAAADPPKND